MKFDADILGLLCAVALFAAGRGAVRAESTAESARIDLQNFRTRGMGPDGRIAWELAGRRADVDGPQAHVSDVTLVLHPKEAARRVVITSPRCRLNRTDRTVHSAAWLRVRSDAFTLYGVGYDIDADASRLSVHSKVHMRILRLERWRKPLEPAGEKSGPSQHPPERKTTP